MENKNALQNELIKELKENIEKQKEENVRLYKTIPIATHEDPFNTKAEPILKQWREGSKILKKMIKELQELEKTERELSIDLITQSSKTFVNSFGEATTREIECQGYKRAEKRTQKSIMNFMGNR